MGAKVLPPAVYPVPDTSPEEVYAVVELFNVALAVYKAILYTYGEVGVKFSKPLKQLLLKIVV